MNRRLFLSVVAIAALAGTAPQASAALPTDAAGFVSNGQDQYGFFTPDGTGVAVYRATDGSQLGSTVTLPIGVSATTVDGLSIGSWSLRGLENHQVIVTGDSAEGALLVGIADATTGQFRTLCGPTPPSTACPSRGPGRYYTILNAGTRWLSAIYLRSGLQTVIPFTSAPGAESVGPVSDATTRAFHTAVPRYEAPDAALDLNRSRVRADQRWGYSRTVAVTKNSRSKNGSLGRKVLVKRARDRRYAAIELPATNGTLRVQFGDRGMCATRGRLVVLWDKTTGRTWQRRLPAGRSSLYVRCTKTDVLAGTDGAIAADATTPPRPGGYRVGPRWSWPTSARPGGWTKGPNLRPGHRLSYR